MLVRNTDKVRPSSSLDAECDGEHISADHTTRDLAVGEFSPVKLCLCSMSLTCGPQLLVGFELFSGFIFTGLIANFKNSFLELGVSKWGEPNFVGFI